MINKYGVCEQCSVQTVITKPSLGLCYKCNNKRLASKKERKKPTGEFDLFCEIWDERDRVSFVSGKALHDFRETKLFVSCFAHILSKGAFPKFRLNRDNIVLLTPHEHHLLDFGSETMRTNYGIQNNCSWDSLYELKEQLKNDYYNEQKGED